jgi:outer membrane biosynthesis protein TonB
MKRWSPIVFLLLATIAVAQESTTKSPFSSDLVLWSHMQQPQQPEQDRPHQAPTPEPTPDTQPAQNPTPSQPSQPNSSENQKQSSTAQAFVGTINKQGDNFLLKVSETISYKLDNQQEVQQYDGKRVRVTGTLDSSASLIHVDKVEPLT